MNTKTRSLMMSVKRKMILVGLANLLLSSATLAEEVDAKEIRKMLIEQNSALCNMMHTEIKSETTRKQYCSCVFTEFYSKISDTEIVETVNALEELDSAGREARRAKRKSSPEEKQQELRKVEEENKRLAATEQACMKKYGIAVR
jgi:hypothetical protein